MIMLIWILLYVNMFYYNINNKILLLRIILSYAVGNPDAESIRSEVVVTCCNGYAQNQRSKTVAVPFVSRME